MKRLALLLLPILTLTAVLSFAQTKQTRQKQQQCKPNEIHYTWVMFRWGADLLYTATRDPFYWLYVEYKGEELARRYCKYHLSYEQAAEILIKEREKYIQELEKPDV